MKRISCHIAHLLLSVLSFTIFISFPVYAEEEFIPCKGAEEFGEIDREQTIIINGEEQPLLCVFKNRGEALDVLRKRIPSLLSAIAEKRHLGEINMYNWRLYEAGLQNIDNSEYSEERIIFLGFFDIYKDDEENEKIIKYVNKRKGNLSEREIEEIVPMLPNFSPIAVRYNQNRLESANEQPYIVKQINSDEGRIVKGIVILINSLLFIAFLVVLYKFIQRIVSKEKDKSIKKTKQK